ncbi:MAG: tetratricopeptide repeat protein [Reinekea sp.]
MTTVIEQIKTGVEAHLNGNLKAAESAYRTAISLDEQNATAYNNLGFVCAQLKRWGEAFECLNTALQLKPDYSMAHTNLGQVLLNMGQEQSGLEHLETAVQCDANNAQAWENLGQIKLRTGDPARAEYCWWRASRQPTGITRSTATRCTQLPRVKTFKPGGDCQRQNSSGRNITANTSGLLPERY